MYYIEVKYKNNDVIIDLERHLPCEESDMKELIEVINNNSNKSTNKLYVMSYLLEVINKYKNNLKTLLSDEEMEVWKTTARNLLEL